MTAPSAATAASSRKAQALAYICDFIVDRGHSPAMIDIARGLRVSKMRAKQLVDQLATDGSIVRLAGSQRAISVPGLAVRAALEQLRACGWTINEDILAIGSAALPKDNLSLVEIIEHLPDDDETGE